MDDPRYPGFVAVQRHAVDGYGLQRLCKDERCTITAAGPDVPLIELLVGVAGSPLPTLDFHYEPGWYCAERQGDQWDVSIEGGAGCFTISHASMLRVFAVIDALRAGRAPDVGEALDADEWDRRYGWARESGLLGSRIDALEALSRRYLLLFDEEGVVPAQPASAALQAARTELMDALTAERIVDRAQPDAIFYQLRDRNCAHLHRVIDALDMNYHLSEICGEVLPEPGTDAWRAQLFAERPAVPGRHRVALDWWLVDPKFPWDGTSGFVNFAHYCSQVFERARVVDLDPVLMEFLGRRLFLLVGLYQGRFELRGALAEEALVDQLIRKVREKCSERGDALAPPATDVAAREAESGLPLPLALRAFLEKIGDGGTINYVRWLSHAEIIAGNDPTSWQRPCPPRIRDARETLDWDGDELPDGLLCISGYFYNQSRAFLLADGRVVWLTPTDVGYTIDPPSLWLCSLL